jgi:NAD-dependent dihydropyrimidine dehydrogenase PreA subunit
MDFGSFLEGPLFWIISLIFIIGVLIRLGFFFVEIIRNSKGEKFRFRYLFFTFARSLVPFHMAVPQRPLYAILRYIFHLCMIVIPIWFSGHIVLWAGSRFEWDWSSLPDEWADWMTIIVLGLAVYFLVRRIVLKEIRFTSSVSDYFLIVFTALPFATGYSLTHGTLDSIAFLGDNMRIIHVASGEVMILMVVFLFCRTRLNTQKCIGCAACEINCPTGTLESIDEGNLRIFSYSHYQCICCASCVKTCPEDAADLRHEISLKRFFQIVPKQEIRSVELKECKRCGAYFAPEPQLDKASQAITGDYLQFCPNCRKANLMDIYYQLAPFPEKIKIEKRSAIH